MVEGQANPVRTAAVQRPAVDSREPETSAAQPIAAAVDRIEELLTELRDKAPLERQLALESVYALFAVSLFLAVFPLLAVLVLSFGIDLEPVWPTILPILLLGIPLAAGLGNLHARRVHPRMEQSGCTPQLLALGLLSGRAEPDLLHVRRSLHAEGTTQRLLQAALDGADNAALQELLRRYCTELRPAGSSDDTRESLKLIWIRWLHYLLLIIYIGISSMVMEGVGITTLLSVPMLLLSLRQARRLRHWYVLRHVDTALQPALEYFRRRASLSPGRGWYDNVPAEVLIQPGSGRLALLASRLQVELQARGSWLGRYIHSTYALPMFLLAGISIFAVAAGVITFAHALDGDAIMFILLGLGLELALLAWISRFVERHAGAVRQRMRELIRRRGLLQEMAMGSLPLEDLRQSCPLFLQALLFHPRRPAALDTPGAEHCWLLMWNLDWFTGSENRQLRQRWLSYLLLLPAIAILPWATLGVYLFLTSFIAHPSESLELLLLSLLGLIVAYWVYLRMLLLSASHLAGAWAVVDELEAAIREGEQEINSEQLPESE
ncbi:hypothetical protein KDL44_10990 [bacterium]|nr:hypothetical protein [bacterium]